MGELVCDHTEAVFKQITLPLKLPGICVLMCVLVQLFLYRANHKTNVHWNSALVAVCVIKSTVDLRPDEYKSSEPHQILAVDNTWQRE